MRITVIKHTEKGTIVSAELATNETEIVGIRHNLFGVEGIRQNPK